MRKAICRIVIYSGKSKSSIAREIGIQRKTLYNWINGETHVVGELHKTAIKKIEAKYLKQKNIEGTSL